MSSKKLELKLYGSLRDFGDIPTSQLTDLRTMVTSIQRELAHKGRPISLAPDRVAAVDEALQSGPFGSLEGLRQQMQMWHSGAQWGSQTVNAWYTEERAVAYHAHNQGSQSILASAAAQMSGNVAPLFLDLGCGSGLSSCAFIDEGFASFVVGVDLSEGMLRTARKNNKHCDWVLADLAQPLPFRENSFDGAGSVGVLHYLLQEAEGQTSVERLRCLFLNIRRCVRSSVPIVFQFFPRKEEHDAWVIVSIARECGLIAELVCDCSHHTSAVRWFLWIYSPLPLTSLPSPHSFASDSASLSFTLPQLEAIGACALFSPRNALCCLGLVSKTQSCGLPAPTISSDHIAWLQNEHVKFARQLIRKLNNLENGGEEKSKKRKLNVGSQCCAKGNQDEAPHNLNNDTRNQEKDNLQMDDLVNGSVKTRTSCHQSCSLPLDLAQRLRARYGAKVSLDELKKQPFDELLTMLH